MRSCLFVVFVVLVGCSGDSTDAPADAAVDALVCTHVQNLRTLAGKVETFGVTKAFRGTVCVEGRPELACGRGDAESTFAMCVPDNRDFGLRFAGETFETTVYLEGTMAGQAPYVAIDDDTAKTMIWTPIGGTYPPTTTGHLVVRVVDGNTAPLANAEVAILPSAGLTVVYANTDPRPSTSRTVTGPAGIAYVANVPAQTFDLQVNSITHPNCVYASGGHLSPDISQDARIETIAGATVVAMLRCTP